MSERSGCEPGVPCRVDLSSTDVTLSVRFYREIFGWEAVFDPRPESGGHGRFTLDGETVAGIGPALGDGVPSAWNAHVATADAEATASAVLAAGGRVVLEPARALGGGIVAAFQDPSGAFLAVWQPVERPVERPVTPVPGTGAGRDALVWNELVTSDVAGCEAFYRAVFDWGAKGADLAGTPYVEWHLHGRPVAGAVETDPRLSRDTPPHWRTCFAVGDVEAVVARVGDLGGRVLVPPSPTPRGTRAVVADPQFAVFGVLGRSAPTEEHRRW
ncbi:VOC family protein [Streptosporangium carneum]|uniref:VOC domain-containing protein n=1 Tax=Streptosporangium carneum TaxID=47481 RepID=A0A9W6I2W5_9ACTN|nr:VOC family protein [Streptosporangium carneum]GLK09965.1 hypothetical protein GCM10017600_33710 [Streptosporangium carneum]